MVDSVLGSYGANGKGTLSYGTNTSTTGVNSVLKPELNNVDTTLNASGTGTDAGSSALGTIGTVYNVANGIYQTGKQISNVSGMNGADRANYANSTNSIKDMTSTGSALGGAVGSVIPGLGTALGSAIGAVIGATQGATAQSRSGRLSSTPDINYNAPDEKYGMHENDTANSNYIDVTENMYNNYKDAMAYMNQVNAGVNGANNNTYYGGYSQGEYDGVQDALTNWGYWAPPGMSDNDSYLTRAIAAIATSGLSEVVRGASKLVGLSGSSKKKASVPYWKVDANTGFSPLDEYTTNTVYGDTADRTLDHGFDWYKDWQQGLYSNRYNEKADNLYDTAEQNALSNYTNNYSSFIQDQDTKDYNKAKKILDSQLAVGYMNQTQYNKALKELNSQRTTNQKSLYDLADAQYNTWKDDLAQQWEKNLLTDDELNNGWISNWNNWKSDNFDYTDAWNAVNGYASNLINDNMMKAALYGNSLYTPYTYIANGMQDSFDNNLTDWAALGNNYRRKALEGIYTGEE